MDPGVSETNGGVDDGGCVTVAVGVTLGSGVNVAVAVALGVGKSVAVAVRDGSNVADATSGTVACTATGVARKVCCAGCGAQAVNRISRRIEIRFRIMSAL
jgi:hypothetical protein